MTLNATTKLHDTSISPFIRKCYQILEERNFVDIIDWNNEGTAIVIKKPIDFERTVLPSYFRHSTFKSFVHQIRLYNFYKNRTRGEKYVYYNEFFQCGDKNLLQYIKRRDQIKNQALFSKMIGGIKDIHDKQESERISTLLKIQLQRRFQEEVFEKVKSLEDKVDELNTQNTALMDQMMDSHSRQEVLQSLVFKNQNQWDISLCFSSEQRDLVSTGNVDAEKTEIANYIRELVARQEKNIPIDSINFIESVEDSSEKMDMEADAEEFECFKKMLKQATGAIVSKYYTV